MWWWRRRLVSLRDAFQSGDVGRGGVVGSRRFPFHLIISANNKLLTTKLNTMIFSKAAFIVTAAFLPLASALEGAVVLKVRTTIILILLSLSSVAFSNNHTVFNL